MSCTSRIIDSSYPKMLYTMALLVWAVSMNTLTYQGHRVSVSAEAESDADDAKASLASDDAAKVYGLLRVCRISVYHSMMRLDQDGKRQLRFWQMLTGRSLHGEAYIFHIDKYKALECPCDLQQFGSHQPRSFVAKLEAEQGPRLWELLDMTAEGMEWLGSEPPANILRAPRPFLWKVLAGTWQSLVFPHLPRTKQHGSSSLTIKWGLCGQEPPPLPAHAQNFPDEDASNPMQLETAVLDEAIDFLQEYAASMNPDTPGELFQEVEYLALQRCVATFQSLLAGLDPSAFVRSARDMVGKGSGLWRSSRRPYQVAFLVKAVTMSSLLRGASAMGEALQTAASILLPNVLQGVFRDLLQTCHQHVPHASSISRWKVVLDGAFMLFRRIRHEALRNSEQPGVVHYLMADASSQHGREFEHIILASIQKQDLGRLYLAANALFDVW